MEAEDIESDAGYDSPDPEEIRRQKDASAQLVAHLRHMFNNPEFSDVVFVAKDGHRVHALRKFLACRSEVLKSMLMNNMVESSLSEIEVREISSSALLSVMEFLYTGLLFLYEPQNWETACDIITASRFFLLPKLETLIVHFLDEHVSVDMAEVAGQLTQAVGLRSPAGDSEIDAVLQRLQELLDKDWSDWSDSVVVRTLSEEAFAYILTKGELRNHKMTSFISYLRFRQVIRWWIHQGGFENTRAEYLLYLLTPDEKEAICLCRDGRKFVMSTPEEAASLLSDWNSSRENQACRDSATRLLLYIDCMLILPVLLESVVEPLEIISPADMEKSFRFHALRGPMFRHTPKCCWEHGESHSTREQGCVVHKTESTAGIGLAVMTVKMCRVYGVYQWRVVLEEFCADFCEVGILPGVPELDISELDGERMSDNPRARVLKLAERNAYVSYQSRDRFEWKSFERYGWHDINKPATAFFTYNVCKRTCSLTVDEHDYGIVWRGLPFGMCLGVSLGTSAKGRVRIELVSEFDIL